MTPLVRKKALRAHMVEVRRQACVLFGEAAARGFADQGEQLLMPEKALVAGYWPMGDEADPRVLLERLEAKGCTLALPLVTTRGLPLRFRPFRCGDPLEPGLHGTLHPVATHHDVIPEVALVPLLAFDRKGFRLGYGGGYYDRTLAEWRALGHRVKTIGLGFAVQEVPNVPVDPHDQRLDAILTETELIIPETP